jgi:hypothetical protein
VTEVEPPAVGSGVDTAGSPEPAPLSEEETNRVRRRVRLMVRVASQIGKYRSGLDKAVKRLTPSEAAIIGDLERHGLDVPQLRDVLCGAHILVDDPELYEHWRFPKSRERLSSHHKKIDKKQFPDIGLKGPLVREKLHGRTQAGTWIQLEKTPAAMGHGFRLPTLLDLQHLGDYIVYRITKSNVGPWGLSKATERRPMYLSPSLGVSVPLPASAEEELTTALERIEEGDDVSSASPDLAARFPPPDRANTLDELVFSPGTRAGRGLFGASGVYVIESPSAAAVEVLTSAKAPPRWTLPAPGRTRAGTVRVGDRELPCAVRRVPVEEQEERT